MNKSKRDVISFEEKVTGVLTVEINHLTVGQIEIDQGDGDFAEKYNGLINKHIRAQISYREANNIKLDDTLFKATDKLQKNGFKLDPDLQIVRDNITVGSNGDNEK